MKRLVVVPRPWLANLVRELLQTERSASSHPIVEAERLGDVPPAAAMRAVAHHAQSALAELPELVARHRLPVGRGGKLVGAALSALREQFADLLVSAEKSYRMTLLGLRHGVDLVQLTEQVARRDGDPGLADWCAAWLTRRVPLVEAVAGHLVWFAANPLVAERPASRNPLARGIAATMHGWEQLADALRR